MRRVLRWSALFIVAVVVVAAIVYAMLPQPVPVDSAIVAVGPMQVTVDEEGRTRIRERYVVSSPLVGRLRRIALDPGDRVVAQQTVLAVIEPTDPELLDARALAEAEGRVRAAEAAVRQAGATLERTRAAYDYAENDLAHVSEAFESVAVSRRELDLAKTAHRTAAEEFRAAQYGQEIAQYELEVASSALVFARGDSESDGGARMSVYSPIDGAVLRVLQKSVAVVTPGEQLIEVGDPLDLEIVIDVLSTDAVAVQSGQRVVIDHWGGPAPLEGVVRLVEPSAFTKTSALGIDEQRVNVIADFVTPAEGRASLGDGFRIEASIVVWEGAEILQIPTSAAFRHGDRWAVFSIESERAVRRDIEVGRRNGQTTQVTNGLSAGDRVVLHPSDQVAPGVRVVERIPEAQR